MDAKYRSRKFGLAVFFTITGTIAFFAGKIDATSWLVLVGEILTLYSGANVWEKKNAQPPA